MPLKRTKPRVEVELKLCQSKETNKLYYGLFCKDTPVKYWACDEISEAGKDLIGELINAFDLGYDVRFQFPRTEKDGSKNLHPNIVKMFNEPGSSHPNPKIEEEYFVLNKEKSTE